MKKPGKLALWTALACFGVFALGGALLGPFIFLAPQSHSVDAMWIAYEWIKDTFGVREHSLGIMMLVAALGYGFIGFDLWLLCWGVYRFFHWGFTWKAPAKHEGGTKKQG
jgi:hypothetical protein